jgi:serine/threonine protein kinase
VIAGTPEFMSPEQARGDPVDHRSDLFSLGSVLYAMCTGRPPFRAENSYAILHRICHTEPRPIRELNAEIPNWLAGIVAKLHAKEPSQRFASAAELAELCERCLAHVQQPTFAPLPRQAQSLRGRRSHVSWRARPLFALGSCVVVALALGAAMIPLTRLYPPRQGEKSATVTASNGSTQRNPTELSGDTDNPATIWDDGLSQELDRVAAEILELEGPDW